MRAQRTQSPVPADVLTRMIAYRIREDEKDGVKWV